MRQLRSEDHLRQLRSESSVNHAATPFWRSPAATLGATSFWRSPAIEKLRHHAMMLRGNSVPKSFGTFNAINYAIFYMPGDLSIVVLWKSNWSILYVPGGLSIVVMWKLVLLVIVLGVACFVSPILQIPQMRLQTPQIQPHHVCVHLSYVSQILSSQPYHVHVQNACSRRSPSYRFFLLCFRRSPSYRFFLIKPQRAHQCTRRILSVLFSPSFFVVFNLVDRL